MNDLNLDPEVERATREVEHRKAELTRNLAKVEKSGERMAERLGEQLKPALIGAAVVVGAATLVAVVAMATRRRPQGWLGPQRPSALKGALRAAGLGLLRLAVQHGARALAQRLAGSVSELEAQQQPTAAQ